MKEWTEKYLDELVRLKKIRGYVTNIASGATATSKRQNANSKYRNKKIMVDGHMFDSKKEANRYFELKVLVAAGEITELHLQREWRFEIDGEKIASYYSDFDYMMGGKLVVEDVKSKATRKLSTYRLKRRMMKVIHGIEIKEV